MIDEIEGDMLRIKQYLLLVDQVLPGQGRRAPGITRLHRDLTFSSHPLLAKLPHCSRALWMIPVYTQDQPSATPLLWLLPRVD